MRYRILMGATGHTKQVCVYRAKTQLKLPTIFEIK